MPKLDLRLNGVCVFGGLCKIWDTFFFSSFYLLHRVGLRSLGRGAFDAVFACLYLMMDGWLVGWLAFVCNCIDRSERDYD